MAMTEKEMNETPVEETVEEAVEETPVPEVNPWDEKYNAERDAHLRVAAEMITSASAPSRRRKPPTATARPMQWRRCSPCTTTWSER